MRTNWQSADVDVFWGEIAPSDHVVQFYEDDKNFLDALAGFVGGGIKADECVIVIATNKHLEALNKRLIDYGISVDTLKNDDRYLPFDAEETLTKFMVDGWPDEELFNQTISTILEKGYCKNRRIRAFGEMVALLWQGGMNGATVRLEHLWNEYSKKKSFSLFCAYPKAGFTKDMIESMQEICGCHTKILDSEHPQLMDVRYANLG